MDNSELRIAGITPLTTIDYPGQLATVIYCQGCRWRCRYCHNPEMIPTKTPPAYRWGVVQDFMLERRDFVDAVVFSGGEATIQSALPEAVRWCKQQGFKVGLHTGGAEPAKLAQVLPLVDWVGFDVKGPTRCSDNITQVKGSGEANWRSLGLVLDSGLPYECRTTVHWDLLSPDDLLSQARHLSALGVDYFVVQICRTQNMFDMTLGENWHDKRSLHSLWYQLGQLFSVFEVREAS